MPRREHVTNVPDVCRNYRFLFVCFFVFCGGFGVVFFFFFLGGGGGVLFSLLHANKTI